MLGSVDGSKVDIQTSFAVPFSYGDGKNMALDWDYAEKMLKFHQYVPDAKVKVHLDAEHPLTFVFSNSNQPSSNESYVRAYIAPMVSDDVLDEGDGGDNVLDEGGEGGGEGDEGETEF